jgi:hypothetical protein
MRGYHSVLNNMPGSEKGVLPDTYYYVTTDKRDILHTYAALNGPFFNREFPTSWRDLNRGIDKMALAPSGSKDESE